MSCLDGLAFGSTSLELRRMPWVLAMFRAPTQTLRAATSNLGMPTLELAHPDPKAQT